MMRLPPIRTADYAWDSWTTWLAATSASSAGPPFEDKILTTLTTLTTPQAATRFSRRRFALLVLLGVYPVITALLYFVVPLTGGWALWQRTLLIAPVMVASMVWGVIPAVQKQFRAFTNPVIEAADPPNSGGPEAQASIRWVLASLSLSMLLSSLGTSIANVGLPTLAVAFDASFQQVQWVVLAYLLAITTLIVSVGRLGDLIGRRRLLLAGISLFTAASVLCGLASTLPLLIAARAAQGLGAAVMMALTMAFVGETVPKAKTGSAMGLLGTMSAVGTALGPTLGGVLIASFGWQAIFFINAPLGVLALVLVRRHLPADRQASGAMPARFDHLGTLLLALTLAAYALAMTTGHGSFGPLNIGLLSAAVVGIGLFLLAESRAASPLVPLAMFRNPLLSAGFAMSALVTTVVMATLVVGPFYLSGALALDAARVGLVMSAGPIAAAVTGVPAGRFVDRFGSHRAGIAGLLAMALGSAVLSLLPSSVGVPGYVAPLVVITAGYALFQAANNTAVMTNIRPEQRGVISGLLNLSRNLGLVTGASVMGTVFTLGSATTGIVADGAKAVAAGMQTTFAVATALIFAALALAAANQALSRRADL
jgi:EmrB/QacA subfamily drug resistance transporter